MRTSVFALLAIFVLPLSTFASVMETRIVDVEDNDAKMMVLAETDGRVLWVNSEDKSLANAIESAAKTGRHLRIDYDDESGDVSGVVLLAKKNEARVSSANSSNKDNGYQPTVFTSVQQAQSYFNTMDNQTKNDSQCYNRAHGWAYDLWNQYQINSLKIFIFFTRRYIREYRYKWWFHVSPMVLVGERGYNTEMVMDRSFTNGPVNVRTWTNIFMKNRVECPHVRYYSQYNQNQEAQYCYLMKSIMYYSTPRDLEYLESRGRYENDWVYSELKAGRQQAFINWQRYDP